MHHNQCNVLFVVPQLFVHSKTSLSDGLSLNFSGFHGHKGMNYADVGDSLTFFSYSTMRSQMACHEIFYAHVPLMMNCNHFIDPLTLHAVTLVLFLKCIQYFGL